MSLTRLLATFDAPDLGEGNLNIGANTLAAMLVTLANLARPGSGIMTPDGRIVPVGCHLLVTGSLMTNMIFDEVVTPVGRCQDILLAQLSRLLEDDKTEAERKNRNLPRRWTLSEGSKASSGENALLQLLTRAPDVEPLIGSYEDEWVEAVTQAPSERFGDLVRRPRSFLAASTPRLLEQQLSGAHLGQALVVIGLNRATDAAKFGDLCPALMDGLHPGGPSGQTVRGRLLVTDSGGVLPEAARADGDATGWLERLLRLVHGSAGPDFPPPPAGDENIVRLPNLSARFEHAVRLLFANRLNSHEPQPVIFEYDLSESQARWMSFLADMEPSLPGISGTARRLLASMQFGLRRLVGAAKIPKDFKYSRDGVEAFAQLLIHRMANAQAVMMHQGAIEKRQAQIEQVFHKLSSGRKSTRTIYRDLRCINAAECRACLWWLREAGLVLGYEADDEWEIVQGARLSFKDCTVPLLVPLKVA
jgi:hypothetical protein